MWRAFLVSDTSQFDGDAYNPAQSVVMGAEMQGAMDRRVERDRAVGRVVG